MATTSNLLCCGLALAFLAGGAGFAAEPASSNYVLRITSDQAQAAMAAAEDEAKHNNWKMSLAVVDDDGNLVMFKRMTGAGFITSQVSVRKAKTAALLRQPSKAFADMAAKGGPISAAFPDLIPVEGGVPITVNSQIVGAIGASGAASFQDAQVASAGANAVR